MASPSVIHHAKRISLDFSVDNVWMHFNDFADPDRYLLYATSYREEEESNEE